MPCQVVEIAPGQRAFVCTSGRAPRCSACGGRATQQCDWKVKDRKSGTCDRWLCRSCSHVPAPDKDLCREHAAQWKARQKA